MTQAALRANIQQSQTMIDQSRELLARQFKPGASEASNGGAPAAP